MATDKDVKKIMNDDYHVIEKVKNRMSLIEEVKLLIKFTKTHQQHEDKIEREIACLKVIYPSTFNSVTSDDVVVGSIDILPVGIGTTTTVGGVGYYFQFERLQEIKEKLKSDVELTRELDTVISYWQANDTREKFFADNLIENELGRFVEIDFPAIVTTRLSGMYLDYNKLVDNGIEGLKQIILASGDTQFHQGLISTLRILQQIIDQLVNDIEKNCDLKSLKWHVMHKALKNIRTNKPKTFVEALELTWLYSLFSSVINYGRMDEYLGDFLVNDLNNGDLTWDTALDYVCDLFDKMEQRRTLANSRVIIGGLGRRNTKNADVFCKLAIAAIRKNQDIEPQLTLRYYEEMDSEVYDLALEAIAEGLTFPIIYNDEVNIPAVKKAMGIPLKVAEKYVPLGCGEINLSGCGVSTPNTCINMLKILTIALNEGVDPADGITKCGTLKLKPVSKLRTFSEVLNQYKTLLDYYIEMTAVAQAKSYEYLKQDISFLATSLLTNDCIARGKAVLDGGVRYLGGTNETYGNISTYDSLVALKHVVFDEKKYSLVKVMKAVNNNFVDYPEIKQALLNAPKFGNDNEYADAIAVEMHKYVCKGIQKMATKVGLDYYLVVVINNQIGTQWGTKTFASPNGREKFTYMSNGVNPQSGCDVCGPTAMLNSIIKLNPEIHAGAVHNIKFSRDTFKKRALIKSLFDSYFKHGGSQLMVSVIGKSDLQEAIKTPEQYKNLVVRVGGFSARFIDLNPNVQREILERTLN